MNVRIFQIKSGETKNPTNVGLDVMYSYVLYLIPYHFCDWFIPHPKNRFTN